MRIPKQNSGINRFRTKVAIKTGSNSYGIKPARYFVCDLVYRACRVDTPGTFGIIYCDAFTRYYCGPYRT
jgi:hypothetical protein